VSETVPARWQHYLVSLWRATIGMGLTVETEQLLQDGCSPEDVYYNRTTWRSSVIVVQKVWQQGISTKECCPRAENIVYSIKQSIIGFRISWNQGRTEGGGGLEGSNPPLPKFRSFSKAEPNSQFRGIYVHP
jgi:hypothetical protein